MLTTWGNNPVMISSQTFLILSSMEPWPRVPHAQQQQMSQHPHVCRATGGRLELIPMVSASGGTFSGTPGRCQLAGQQLFIYLACASYCTIAPILRLRNGLQLPIQARNRSPCAPSNDGELEDGSFMGSSTTVRILLICRAAMMATYAGIRSYVQPRVDLSMALLCSCSSDLALPCR